jgi:hypothetical protein
MAKRHEKVDLYEAQVDFLLFELRLGLAWKRSHSSHPPAYEDETECSETLE